MPALHGNYTATSGGRFQGTFCVTSRPAPDVGVAVKWIERAMSWTGVLDGEKLTIRGFNASGTVQPDGSVHFADGAIWKPCLRHGWVTWRSRGTGDIYYHHPATGMSQWDRPL